ncbi:hypothetical protein SETIT_4G076800v2 [Setaria italica]|uniref:Uncharacterized protein n=1 Tax=Setaria italica TaxID=4555 RepID=A0A368QSD6_SETIT|nr:hypothetical protein SETIT_4G076800v2 [Setaria italica]RCV20689.1 hypothetical protein SETIT_4G076800v2 [Setaria italica]RCV20690.1 hypothetical protein SETIT_4G076800v2 [Setaria italica]
MSPYVMKLLGFEEISTYLIYVTSAFFAGGSCQLLFRHLIPSHCSQRFWKLWALNTQFGSALGISLSRKTEMSCSSKLKILREELLDPVMNDKLARDWALVPYYS